MCECDDVMAIVDELITIYDKKFDTIERLIPPSSVREIEHVLGELVLKYVFLAQKASREDIQSLRLVKILFEIVDKST